MCSQFFFGSSRNMRDCSLRHCCFVFQMWASSDWAADLFIYQNSAHFIQLCVLAVCSAHKPPASCDVTYVREQVRFTWKLSLNLKQLLTSVIQRAVCHVFRDYDMKLPLFSDQKKKSPGGVRAHSSPSNWFLSFNRSQTQLPVWFQERAKLKLWHLLCWEITSTVNQIVHN